MRLTFGKEESLCGKKQISLLFAEGDSFFQYPFKVIFLRTKATDIFPVQLLISVSKRNFKKAVDRNKIKRLVREAYRLNKHLLYEGLTEKEESMLLGFIYTAKTTPEFKEVERKIILILQRLIKGDAETAG